MSARDIVKEALGDFIVRACGKESLTQDQLRAIEIFLEHFSFPQPRQSRVKEFLESQEQETSSPIPIEDTFPHDRLVTGEEAARFLGYGDFKHPAGKVRRLAEEGKIPPPVKQGNRALRWDAADIRRYKESISGNGGKAA
jgi:predicted DNA-binding transcriptional regulator AlpA